MRFVTKKFALLSTLSVKLVFHLYLLCTYIQYKYTVFHSICKMVITRQTTKVMDSSTSQQEREAENNNNTVLCDRCKCVVTVKFEEMKSTMDDIKEILSRTQTYQDSWEDSLFVLNEQFNELKQNRERCHSECAQLRMI